MSAFTFSLLISFHFFSFACDEYLAKFPQGFKDIMIRYQNRITPQSKKEVDHVIETLNKLYLRGDKLILQNISGARVSIHLERNNSDTLNFKISLIDFFPSNRSGDVHHRGYAMINIYLSLMKWVQNLNSIDPKLSKIIISGEKVVNPKIIKRIKSLGLKKDYAKACRDLSRNAFYATSSTLILGMNEIMFDIDPIFEYAAMGFIGHHIFKHLYTCLFIDKGFNYSISIDL